MTAGFHLPRWDVLFLVVFGHLSSTLGVPLVIVFSVHRSENVLAQRAGQTRPRRDLVTQLPDVP